MHWHNAAREGWKLAALLMCAAPLMAQIPVALLQAGFGKGCLLHRSGREPEACFGPRLLYPGDVLTRASGLKGLRIQWFAPPETHSVRKDSRTLLVAWKPPQQLSQALKFSQRAVPKAARAAMEARLELRTAEIAEAPHPPSTPLHAALTQGPLPFPEEDGAVFEIWDERGALIYRGPCTTPDSVNSLKIETGTYTWTVVGKAAPAGRFRLLEPTLSRTIRDHMTHLAASHGTDAQTFYLRVLEQMHPEWGVLSWMSERASKTVLGQALNAPRTP